MSARRLLIFVAAAALALAGGISVARRSCDRRMVDWPQATRLAYRLSGEPRDWMPDNKLGAGYKAIVDQSFGAVSAYTGLPMRQDNLGVRVVGRTEWVETNIQNFRATLGPILKAYESVQMRTGALGQVVGTATRYGFTGQIGILLGVLSRRVLGQYDIPLLKPDSYGASIYFVEPNIAMLARRSGIRLDDLRMWVALHESTHAFQFQVGDPPWLHSFTSDLLQQYIGESVEALRIRGQFRPRLRDGLHQLRKSELRSAGLWRLALTNQQAAAIGRIQAIMTLMEGYSNHVMRATGARIIPDYDQLAQRMQAREQSRSTASRFLALVLGLEMKLEQYRVGEAFVDHVVVARDLTFANRAWAGPENLPTLAETYDPRTWIERMERDLT